MDMRTCRVCGETLDAASFYDPTSTSGIAAGACCRSCWVAKSTQWRKDNRDRWNTTRHRAGTIKRLGIDGETYDRLMSDARCAGCGSPNGQIRTTTWARTSRLTIDHDHQTGRIRGILCHPCNMAIGQTGDDPNVLRRLADYLDDTCF